MSLPNVISQYTSYPFDTDEQYQQGLSSILSSGALEQMSDEDKTNLFRRSRVFYFNQMTGQNISEEDAQRAEGPRAAPEQLAEEQPRILSFAELQELITQGRTDEIPNNKQIPDALNDSTPSVSTEQPKKKPWEK